MSNRFILKFAAILLVLITILSLVWKFSNYPLAHFNSLFVHILIFLGLSFFFVISLSELGKFVRTSLIKINFRTLDLGIGIGTFAWFLQFYNKIDVGYTFPALFLIFCFVYAIISFIKQNESKRLFSLQSNFWTQKCIILIAFVHLTEFGKFDGLLEYTTDFDSSFHHIVLAQTIVTEGHFFSPLWLRAPFIPQLTHSLYIFILSIFNNDTLYIKVINWLAFYQISHIFLSSKNQRIFWVGAVSVLLLAFIPEFAYLYNTNLDALLGLFFFCSIVSFSYAIRTNFGVGNVFFIVLFCGFASGQKHFGLMFSAPILFLSFALALEFFWKNHLIGKSASSIANTFFTSRTTYGYILAFGAFFLIFIPFYFHNILSNANLFFPFFGSKENGFGWSKEEIEYFTGPTINHWGHQKTWLGFFELPFDIINFPEDFQFFKTNSWEDFVVPMLFFIPILILCYSVFTGKIRDHGIPSIILILCYLSWFKSSQVIRYLFPISIGSLYLLYFSLSKLQTGMKANDARRNMILFLLLYAYLFSTHFVYVNFMIPSNSVERMIHRGFLYGKILEGNLKILQINRSATVLEFGPQAVISRSIFHNIRFCGDWYGGCAYGKYTYQLAPIRFKSWSDIQTGSSFLKIDYISVYWTEFSGGIIPSTKQEFDEVFPKSVRDCIEPFYHVDNLYDIYSVKAECK